MTGRGATYRVPAAIYTAVLGCLLVLQFLWGQVLGSSRVDPTIRHPAATYLASWVQYDGGDYLRIATGGYQYVPGERSNIVWFPLYPLCIRVVQWVTGDAVVAAVAISAVAGLAASLLFWHWLGRNGIEGTTRLVAFGLFAGYPFGWFLYGVVYADALFVALALGAFLLVGRDRWVLGGLVAALATAARPTGLALIPALGVLGLQRGGVLVVPAAASGLAARFALPTRIEWSRRRAAMAGPLLAVAGIGAYATYLWVRFGSPILFLTNESTYHPTGAPLLKKAFLSSLLHVADTPRYALSSLAQFVITVGVIWLLPAICRRFGFAYGLFLAVLIAMPMLTTSDFLGLGRYLMVAFPAFAILGERLAARPRLAGACIATGGLAMAVLAAMFSRSAYLT